MCGAVFISSESARRLRDANHPVNRELRGLERLVFGPLCETREFRLFLIREGAGEGGGMNIPGLSVLPADAKQNVDFV